MANISQLIAEPNDGFYPTQPNIADKLLAGIEWREVMTVLELLNPFTRGRGELQRVLDEYGAEIDYYDGAFKNAERRTGVEIAIVKLNIEKPERESVIWENLKAAAAVPDENTPDCGQMTELDTINGIVRQYELEVASGVELIREYDRLSRHITETTLLLGSKYGSKVNLTVNNFVEQTRLNYWRKLFENEKITKNLTSAQRQKHLENVQSLKCYDFSLFNVRQILAAYETIMCDTAFYLSDPVQSMPLLAG